MPVQFLFCALGSRRVGRVEGMQVSEPQGDGGWPMGTGEMARRIREHDWAATSLGPIGTWSVRLRVLVEAMLASS